MAAIIIPTILSKYTSEPDFTQFLTNVGVGAPESAHLITDGFTNMSMLVKHFSYDIGAFKSHLQALNKTFVNAGNARRIYYNPIIINRLVGILYYFSQAVNTFHTIPNMDEVDQDMADNLGTHYMASLRKADDTDDSSNVKLPSLLGSSNWRAFKDKLLLKLGTMKSTRGITMEYVVDDTPRTVTRANTNKILVETLDVHDDDFIRMNATHFGTYYKEDNAKLATMLKKLLVNTPAYNHIATAITNKNGKQAVTSLQNYYEGPDFVDRNIEQAFNALNNTFYQGEHKNFNFEKYVAIHLEAHRLLLEAKYNNSLGMDNATKIQHLKAGIKLDAGLEHAMTTARTNKLAQGDFPVYVSFMACEVDVKVQRLKQLSSSRSRQILDCKVDFAAVVVVVDTEKMAAEVRVTIARNKTSVQS